MADACVVNTSPLIFLARGGHLELLRIFGGPVYVPRVVAEEVRRRGPGDPTVRALTGNRWLDELPDRTIPPAVQTWALGPGESSVIAEALSRPG